MWTPSLLLLLLRRWSTLVATTALVTATVLVAHAVEVDGVSRAGWAVSHARRWFWFVNGVFTFRYVSSSCGLGESATAVWTFNVVGIDAARWRR